MVFQNFPVLVELDDAPVQGGGKGISSGGVYDALLGKVSYAESNAADLNTLTGNGWYLVTDAASNTPYGVTDGLLLAMSVEGGATHQMMVPATGTEVSHRYRSAPDGDWTDWSSAAGEYVPLAGGNVTGDLGILGYLTGTYGDGKKNHAIKLGSDSSKNMNFYEQGALFRFYRVNGETNDLLGQIEDGGWVGKVNGFTIREPFVKYDRDEINIDTQDGCWSCDVTDSNEGTKPTSSAWINVRQVTSGYFYTQIAISCVNSETADRPTNMWIREKHLGGEWSNWLAVYTEGGTTDTRLGNLELDVSDIEGDIAELKEEIESDAGLYVPTNDAATKDFNSCNSEGWYHVKAMETNVPDGHAYGLVLTISDADSAAWSQTFFPDDSPSVYHRRFINSEWSAWEREVDGYLPLSGGEVTGNLHVDGSLQVDGVITGKENSTNDRAISLGNYDTDPMKFYSVNGEFQFYTKENGSEKLLGKITEDGWEGTVVDPSSTFPIQIYGHNELSASQLALTNGNWRTSAYSTDTSSKGNLPLANRHFFVEQIVTANLKEESESFPYGIVQIATAMDYIDSASPDKGAHTWIRYCAGSSDGAPSGFSVNGADWIEMNAVTDEAGSGSASGDYLPLDGGTVDGNVEVTGQVLAGTLFSRGDVTVRGTISQGSTATGATGDYSSAFGNGSVASGASSHAEGDETTASSRASHAEGYKSKATDGFGAHAEGYQTNAEGQGVHAEGSKTLAQQIGSHAEGDDTIAEGYASHSEGHKTVASGSYSHAEGGWCEASGTGSHTEGYKTTASGEGSHAEGNGTTASGPDSHAEGAGSVAEDDTSHAAGRDTIANNYAATAIGKYNKRMNSWGAPTTQIGDVFVIGNGVGDDSRSNAFRVSYSGAVYALSAFNASGADYAEYFEWVDGNAENEDRVGHFVTMEGTKISKANEGDYILGVTSANPCIIGNADEDWLGRWEHDAFGRFVMEEVEGPSTKEVLVPVLDENGAIVRYDTETVEIPESERKNGWKYKANPAYDPSRPYTERKDRMEWMPVGMVGVLAVRDDGTCKVNGYAKVASGGTATASEGYEPGRSWRVVERTAQDVVRIIFK